ncbi:MAG: GGDEF domain-containing protein [Desulfarculaceae bacterium]|nr:GGDEF domain-containing protein [Desulfarculaceae bacterium]
MKTIDRFQKKMTAALSMLFGSAARDADHRRLARYIISLNQKESPEEIINELASCLKNILNYRLFGFAVKKDETTDAWIDPQMYKHSLEEVIRKDFHLENRFQINYLNHRLDPDESVGKKFSMENLTTYTLGSEDYQAKVYMLAADRAMDRHGDMVQMILQSTQAALSKQISIERLTDAAIIDPLTGCYNRRELENQLKKNMAHAARHNNDLSVFMFDLDHFKDINDRYGHPAGDRVLMEVASTVRANIRQGDILARYGGEEFIAILPETDRQKAKELAERLREKISRLEIQSGDRTISVTASFGVVRMRPDSTMDRLIADADIMLYKAKKNGRNTIMPGLIKVCPPKASGIKESSFV